MKKIILAGAAALTLVSGVSAQQPTRAPVSDITRASAIADAERRFATLDANRNGQLDAAELQKAAEARRAERRQQMEQRFAQMTPEERARVEQRRGQRAGAEGGRRGGRDGAGGLVDGPVTLAQFRARAEQRFDRLDLDRNGVITVAEQTQLRAQRGTQNR